MGTLNTALYFGLSHLGAVAPGYQADLVVFDNFKNFQVERVFKNAPGCPEGKIDLERLGAEASSPPRVGQCGLAEFGEFSIKAEKEKAKVIGVVPGELITKKLMLSLKTKDGFAISDPRRDILKIAVIERHTASGKVGLGFVRGFGLRSGALASSVAHDSHNIIVVGTNDGDMMTAAIEVARLGGGQVVVDRDRIKASLALPIAGLISPKPLLEVCRAITLLNQAAHDLGSSLKDPIYDPLLHGAPPDSCS